MATPANSPCAPAIGVEADRRHAGDVLQHLLQLEQAGQESLAGLLPARADGAPGTAAASPRLLQARGLYFMVQEPSG